jgi:hypothetical protein
MDVSGCREQCLDTKLFFEFSKHSGRGLDPGFWSCTQRGWFGSS